MEDLGRFCCLNPKCDRHGQRGQGNIAVRARYGPHKRRLLYCKACKRRFRADHLDERPWLHYCPAKKDSPFEIPAGAACRHCGARRTLCPECGRGELTEPRQFNMMLKTFLGPVEEAAAATYLRPETAQGMFVNFENVLQSTRRKLPFGIAQIGRSFRNEITPGNFIFRTREFEQMELEFFVNPLETIDGRPADEWWHQHWINARLGWYLRYGIRADNLRLREHAKEELAHYSKRTVDIEYRFGFPGSEWGELEGIANRTDFDLSTHVRASGQDMSYLDADSGERYVPYVIEPAAGVDRCVLVLLIDAYAEDEAPDAKGTMEKRTVLRLDHRIAPVKVAVLPLSRNADLSPKARDIAARLRKRWHTDFDDASAIGRRYRRQDEIGTPFCVTVDFETLSDQAVTVRERDTMRQDRVGIDGLEAYLAERLAGC